MSILTQLLIYILCTIAAAYGASKLCGYTFAITTSGELLINVMYQQYRLCKLPFRPSTRIEF